MSRDDEDVPSWRDLYADKLPSDLVYEEGIHLGDIVFTRFMAAQELQRDIAWEQDLDATGEMIDASTYLATQLHYMNLSHLILYGRILTFETVGRTFDAQKLVSLLTTYRIECIEAWGRYLGKTAAGVNVNHSMHNYYRELFAEDTALDVIVGTELLSAFTYGLYEALDGTGDSLFQQIVSQLADRREDELTDVQEYLSSEIAQLDDTQLRKLSTTVHIYLQHLRPVILSSQESMETLNVGTSQEHINSALKQFHDDLGLAVSDTFRNNESWY